MKKREKDGVFIPREETLAKARALYPYFRIEEGRDGLVRHGNEFANPYFEEAMSMETATMLAGEVGLDATPEGCAALSNGTYDAMKAMWKQGIEDHPEFDEFGFSEEYTVTEGCPEEPDAPPFKVYVRHVKDSYKKGPHPVIFATQLGGLVLSSVHQVINAPGSKFLGATIVAPVIRNISSGHGYPSPINDLHAAYQWMVNNAEMLNVDLDRVILFGISSGAHMSTVLPFRLKRYNWCGAPKLRGVVCWDPSCDDREVFTSSKEICQGWSGLACRSANMTYMGKNFASAFIGPEAYANHATIAECKGLPPYAMITNQDAPGGGSCIAFMKKLSQAGVHASFQMYGGVNHTYTADVNQLGSMDKEYELPLGITAPSRIGGFMIGNFMAFLNNDYR